MLFVRGAVALDASGDDQAAATLPCLNVVRENENKRSGLKYGQIANSHPNNPNQQDGMIRQGFKFLNLWGMNQHLPDRLWLQEKSILF